MSKDATATKKVTKLLNIEEVDFTKKEQKIKR